MWRAGLLLAILGAACATPVAERQPQTKTPPYAPGARLEPALDSFELRQDNDRLRREVEELRAELANVREDLDRTSESLWAYQRAHGDVSERPRYGDGRVLAVRGHVVQLSVGAADRVRPGDMFLLRRGADYVGMAIVKEVRENTAYARVEKQDRGKASPPRPGDLALPYR